MKTFKMLDWLGQCLLIVSSLLLVLFQTSNFNFDTIAWTYGMVGAWQVLSTLAHLFLPGSVKIKGRKIYHVLLLSVAVLGLFALGYPTFSVLYLMLLLFASPIMAIFYVIICYKETKKLELAVQSV